MSRALKNVEAGKVSVFVLSSSLLLASSGSLQKTDKDTILRASHMHFGYKSALCVRKQPHQLAISGFGSLNVHATVTNQHRRSTVTGRSIYSPDSIRHANA